MSTPTLAEMSGEKSRAPRLPLNEITINGQTGHFRYRDVKAGLMEVEGGRKEYPTKELGKEIKVIFLKVRRKLMAHQENARPLATNEHDAKTDVVNLFGVEGGTRVGTAEQIREQFQNLRTVQVVYAIYEGELVRLFVKGASLGSQVKASDVHDFYSYISSFKDNGRDGHFYESYTKLYSLQEKGKLGPYYCIGYEEAEKLDAEQMKDVEKNMTIAFEFAKEVDEYYGTKSNKESVKPKEEAAGDLPSVEYPEEEELNPEDIPF